MNLKDKIKAIPILGWFLRWINNILRINSLYQKIEIQQNIINQLVNKIEAQQNIINRLSEQQIVKNSSRNLLSECILSTKG